MLTGITFDPRTFAPTVAPGKELEYLPLDMANPLSGLQEASHSQGRGWSERMCFNVGTFYTSGNSAWTRRHLHECCAHANSTGLLLGGSYGFIEGLRSPLGSASSKLRLNTVLNACTRRGPFLGNSAAVGGNYSFFSPVTAHC